MTTCLASCSLFGIYDRSDEYVDSQTLPNLKMPAGAVPADTAQHYVVPGGNTVSAASAQLMVPPTAKMISAPEVDLPDQITSVILGADDEDNPQLQVMANYSTAWKRLLKVLPALNYTVIGSDKGEETGLITFKVNSAQNTAATIYELNVTQANTAVLISIADQQGDPVDAAVSQPLLAKIKTGLTNS